MENTVHIAESCNLEIELGNLKLPKFPIPTPFVEPDAYLKHLCEEGCELLYGGIDDCSALFVNGFVGFFKLSLKISHHFDKLLRHEKNLSELSQNDRIEKLDL